jgi:hypothetical protein
VARADAVVAVLGGHGEAYSGMATGNTPYSKTKPFWEIMLALGATPFENHPNTLRSYLTIAFRPVSASPAIPPAGAHHSNASVIYGPLK